MSSWPHRPASAGHGQRHETMPMTPERERAAANQLQLFEEPELYMTRAHRGCMEVAEARARAASAAKAERVRRERLLEARQAARCAALHDSATRLRDETTSSVAAQSAQVHRQRHESASEVKRQQHNLRLERRSLLAQHDALAAQNRNLAVNTQRRADAARSDVRASNLSAAQRANAALRVASRESSRAQAVASASKKEMASKVRDEAGLGVVRDALHRAGVARAVVAARIRQRSAADTLQAELAAARRTEQKNAAAMEVERAASPAAVRQLKQGEEARKHSLTTNMRRENRAKEALALDRRREEALYRRSMHDAVVRKKYSARDIS